MITTQQGTSIKISSDRIVFVSKNKRNFYAVGTVTDDNGFEPNKARTFGPDVLRAIAELIDGLPS